VIEKPVAIEHHLADPCVEGAPRDELTDLLRRIAVAGLPGERVADLLRQTRRGGEGAAAFVGDELGVDVPRAPENGEPMVVVASTRPSLAS